MASWAGFTDDDLRKLKGEPTENQSPLGMKKAAHGGSTAVQKGKPPLKRLAPRQGQQSKGAPVSPAAMLSQPKLVPRKMQYIPEETNNNEQLAPKGSKSQANSNQTGPGESNLTSNDVGSEQVVKTAASGEGVKAEGESNQDSKKEENDMVLDEDEILCKEIDNLEKFRENQKKIEDMNKRKKQALFTAIQQRQKQAKSEVTKLASIQKELKTLDMMVTADVSVIRDKIENASREFLEAQKRYDRVEREFIEAKMDLHRKEELKEQLTDHLYAIIHQNEVRKAKKLAELMDKLNMETAEEEGTTAEELAVMELPAITLLQPVHVVKATKSPPAATSEPADAPLMTEVKGEGQEVKGEGQSSCDGEKASEDASKTEGSEVSKDTDSGTKPQPDSDSKAGQEPSKTAESNSSSQNTQEEKS